jgi:AcrR family transcriptional regulator
MAMGNSKKTRARATRDDWLQVGLKLLATNGINAVTVNAIAVNLGITRGSFYHHFKNREELSAEILDFWAKKWTIELFGDVSALDLDGFQSLRAMMHLIAHRQAAEYDLAVRSWALHDPVARDAVKKVDKIRLDFVRSQFQKLGFEGLDLENRSRLHLYYSMTKPEFFDPPNDETAKQLDELRLNFLTARPEIPIRTPNET